MNVPDMNKAIATLCLLVLSLPGCSAFRSSSSSYEYRIDFNEIDGDVLRP